MKVTRGGLAQTALIVVGAWLMAAPAVLGHSGTDLGASDRVAGPVILATAYLSVFSITRLVRWFNALPGAWLLVAPFVLDGTTAATVNDLVCGVLVLSLAWVEKAPQDSYGGGWDTLVKKDRLPQG
ncbi:MAG: SPW repeat protein [Proteobacteria bacterium]|nr:SPW repeat protein [Pseudomonadota bacterium]